MRGGGGRGETAREARPEAREGEEEAEGSQGRGEREKGANKRSIKDGNPVQFTDIYWKEALSL